MLFLVKSLSSLWKYFFLVRLYCSVYILHSLLAASCMCSWARTVAKKLSEGGLYFRARGLNIEIWQKLNEFIVFRISIWGTRSFVWGDMLTKAPVATGLSWAPYLFDCKPQLIKFFHHFMRLIIREGRLTFFIFLLYRNVLMTLSLSLVTFCQPNSSFPFDFLQHHVHIRHRSSDVAMGGRSAPFGTFMGSALWAINLQRLYWNNSGLDLETLLAVEGRFLFCVILTMTCVFKRLLS